MIGVASLRVPYWSIPWNGSTLQFYPRSPGPLRPTYLCLIPAIYRCTLLIPGVLGYFFFVCYPSEKPPRLPLVHDLYSFFSNLAWSIGWDQWEEEEEEEKEERQEVAFWGPLSKFPLCSCWLTGLSNQVFSSGPLLLLPLRISSLSEQWPAILDEWRRA